MNRVDWFMNKYITCHYKSEKVVGKVVGSKLPSIVWRGKIEIEICNGKYKGEIIEMSDMVLYGERPYNDLSIALLRMGK